MKSLFPNQEWTDHALKMVRKYGLDKLHPKDEKEFCSYGMNEKNWVHLLAAMCKFESNFKPSTMYTENFKNSRGEWVISTGLFQLSYESVQGYGFTETTAGLKEPLRNIEIAVAILTHWVKRDGVISSSSNKGGARYWSVLRPSGKLASVKRELRNNCQDEIVIDPDPGGGGEKGFSFFTLLKQIINAIIQALSKKPKKKKPAEEVRELDELPEVFHGVFQKMTMGRHADKFRNPRYIAAVKFEVESTKGRLFVWDRVKKEYVLGMKQGFRCSHGAGKKGHPHDGKFYEASNTSGTHLSSLGLIKTAETYHSAKFKSIAMRLDGLDETNSKIRPRAIVFHQGYYVRNNPAGRSWGCLVVDPKYNAKLIALLKGGSPIDVTYNGKAFVGKV